MIWCFAWWKGVALQHVKLDGANVIILGFFFCCFWFRFGFTKHCVPLLILFLTYVVPWKRLLTTFRWVSITPFGSPVVPLEYSRKATSSKSIWTFLGKALPLSFAKSVNGVQPAVSPKTIISWLRNRIVYSSIRT